MADLAEETKTEWEHFLKGVSALLDAEKQAVEAANDAVERDDKFTVWIVGLSVGTIAGLSVSERLASIPQWHAMIIFAFFLLSILTGSVYRWILKETYGANRLMSFAIQTKLVGITLDKLESALTILSARIRLQQILSKNDGDPKFIEAVKNSSNWQKWGTKTQYVPTALFFLGVLSLAIFATMNWPPPLPVDITPKQVPQIRQG